MAYSKQADFKRWIKKLKFRSEILERNGDMKRVEDLKRKITRELKEHGV